MSVRANCMKKLADSSPLPEKTQLAFTKKARFRVIRKLDLYLAIPNQCKNTLFQKLSGVKTSLLMGLPTTE